MLLEVVVETQTSCTADEKTSPVDVDTVLPSRPRLIHERLRKELTVGSSELVETKCTIVVEELLVEEGVAEASYRMERLSLAKSLTR